MEFNNKPGDTVIGFQQTIESLMVLSDQSRKKDLLPLLYKLPTLRSNIADFLQSLVIHERLYFTTIENHFDYFLSEANLEILSEFTRPLPPEILLKKVEKAPYAADIENIKLTYMHLVGAPGFFVWIDLLELFNNIFPMFTLLLERKDEIGRSSHDYKTRFLTYYEKLASFAADLAYSTIGSGHPSKAGYQLYLENALDKVENVAQERVQQINKWLKQSRFSISAPLVFGYIVEKAKGKKDIISTAIEIRNSKEAVAFRNQCSLFDEALATGNDKVLLEMANEIDDKTKQLSNRIGNPKINIDISFPLAITIKPRDISEYIKTKRKRHLIFISQLYESAIISRNTFDRFSQLL